MELMSSNNAKHALGYHIVWCPKYRHQVLSDLVEIELKKLLSEACASNGWKIHALEVMPDHVHLFIQADHTIAPMEIVRYLKSVTAIGLFLKFPHLKKQKFWGSGLWSKGTFYSTVGSVSEKAIRHYIDNQKSDSSHGTSP